MSCYDVSSQEACEPCECSVEASTNRAVGLSFGEALKCCRAGARITREGWNGKGMFVYFQEGSLVEIADLRCTAIKNWAEDTTAGSKVLIHGHFDMKAADDTIVIGWLASQTDMLAHDWRAE